MNNYKVQMPLDTQIKDQAEKKAKSWGLKNINDTIRFLLTNFAKGRINIVIEEKESLLKYKNKLDKRYQKATEGLKKGTVKSYKSVQKLMDDLDN